MFGKGKFEEAKCCSGLWENRARRIRKTHKWRCEDIIAEEAYGFNWTQEYKKYRFMKGKSVKKSDWETLKHRPRTPHP